MTHQQRWMGLLLLASAAALSACGGGGDAQPDSTPAAEDTNTLPTSATASVQAFVDFVGAQKPADHAEPMKLHGVTPPTSETAEPLDGG